MIFTIYILLYIATVPGHAEFPRKEKSRSVWIEQGLVRGNIFRIGNRHVQIFRGIPYAEPPIGELRFAKSVKKSRWHYEHLANDYGAACLQFNDHYINDKYSKASMGNQSENCLFLNIFSPYDPEDEGRLYPILVWIHGGSFMAGSGDTGIDMEVTVENIVFKNVSLVTFNYRLGPLGFMSYQNGDYTDGNFGIWDQVTVLEWIQANMKQLNGDPSNVTVMGESAGAAAASLLAVSPRTQNLLHRVITLSGSAAAGWAVHRHRPHNWDISNVKQYLKCKKSFSEEKLQKLGLLEESKIESKHCNLQDKELSCLNVQEEQELSNGELLDCFRKELNFSSFAFRQALANELGISKMIVDGDLLPSSGKELIRQNSRIPLLIGVSRKECGRKQPEDYEFHQYGNVSKEERKNSVRMLIKDHYHAASEKQLHNSTLDLISTLAFIRYFAADDNFIPMNLAVSKLQKMESDIDFVAPAQKEIEAYTSNGLPVYAFSFDYAPTYPVYEVQKKSFNLFGNKVLLVNRTVRPITGGTTQAFHGLQHAYIFTKGYKSSFQFSLFSEKDENMSQILTQTITNFVKYGRPTSGFEEYSWLPYTNYSATYLSLTTKPRKQKGSLHWPDTLFWNKEADLLEKFSFRERHCPKENYDLSSEERLQLAAYRRAWWALWVLVALIGIAIWGCIIFAVVKRCRSPRAKPYDNIVFNR